MSTLTATSLAIIHRQLGAISAAQLRTAGVSDRGRRNLLESETLVSTGHSVYRVPGIPLTLEARLVVLSLQHPSGFVTGPTGGGQVGLRRMPASSRIHFCVAHGSRTTVPNYVMLRQSNRILPHHIRPLENGITLASWERLAFDLATDLRRFDLSSVVEQMVQWTVTDMERLGAVAREMCGPGRAGSRSFAGVLLDRHPGAAAESHPELRVLVGLRARGVPVVPQVSPLVLNDGTRIRIDMAVPDLKWAVEVDVHPDHLDLVGTTRDKRRDRQLHLIGWQVERVTRLDLLDLRGTLTELAQLYARRAAQLVA